MNAPWTKNQRITLIATLLIATTAGVVGTVRIAAAQPAAAPVCYQAIRLEPGYSTHASYTIYTCRDLFAGNAAMPPALLDCDVVGGWTKWKTARLRWPSNVIEIACPPEKK